MFAMEKKTKQISILTPNDWPQIIDFLSVSGMPYSADEAAHLHGLITAKTCIFIACFGTNAHQGQIIGGGYLNFAPKYRPYQALKIPEFQDLRVLTPHRNQGIGRALVEAAQELAQQKGHIGMGLSVGLTPQFGPAQRLYAKLGYIPDGEGITIDRTPAQHGDTILLNDDCCLMLLKLF